MLPNTDLAVDLEPNITLRAAFDNRAYGHQADDERLPLLDLDQHLLANVRPGEEVASRNDTERNNLESYSVCHINRIPTSSRRTSQ